LTTSYKAPVKYRGYTVEIGTMQIDCGSQGAAIRAESEALLPAILLARGLSGFSAEDSAVPRDELPAIIMDFTAREREYSRGVAYVRSISLEARFRECERIICTIRRNRDGEDSLASAFTLSRLVNELVDAALTQLDSIIAGWK
jgi:hypothetical protein